MKCLPKCGYTHYPDNINLLRQHLEDCLTDGACKTLKKDPIITWKDGEFAVVEKATKKDKTFPLGVQKREVFSVPEEAKTPLKANKKSIKANPGKISSQAKKTKPPISLSKNLDVLD